MKGRYWLSEKFWLVEVSALDVTTQGEDERDALEMIADAVVSLVGVDGFAVWVTQTEEQRVEHTFTLNSNDQELLVALGEERKRAVIDIEG